jgi:hypothetical protein
LPCSYPYAFQRPFDYPQFSLGLEKWRFHKS